MANFTVGHWGAEIRTEVPPSNPVGHPYFMPNWKYNFSLPECFTFGKEWSFGGNRISGKIHVKVATGKLNFPRVEFMPCHHQSSDPFLHSILPCLTQCLSLEKLNLCLILPQWISLSWIILLGWEVVSHPLPTCLFLLRWKDNYLCAYSTSSQEAYAYQYLWASTKQ